MSENQAAQRLAQVLSRIMKLPSANLEPPQFFANFLQLAVAATGSRGGAVWIIQSGQQPQCYCHVEMELCLINQPDQQQLLLQAVGRTVKETKPLVLPGAGTQPADSTQDGTANLCEYPLFFKPIKAAEQVPMVLQMIGDKNLSPQDFNGVLALLEQISESAQTYLAHRRAAVLEDDRKSLAKLLKFAEGVHDSLDAEKVIYQTVNLGRDAIGCDRVVVWIDPALKRGLRAVSGIDKPDRRAVLMQSLEKLSRHCLKIKKPIVAAREQLAQMSEEEDLTQLIKDYFNVSQLDQIFLQPIRREDDFMGVLIAEGFDEQRSVNLAGVMATVSSHCALALNNALEMASVPMIRPLSRLKKVRQDPKKKRKWLITSIVILVSLAALAIMPWPVKVECACELTPRHVRIVESPLDAVQIISIEHSSGKIQKGDVIAVLDDLELRTQLISLRQELEQENIKRDQALSDTDIRFSKLQIERLNNEIRFYEEQIRKCRVRSPINGAILTAQLERKEGLTLKKGDAICEIADLTQWQLRLDVLQKEIDWLRRGLDDENEADVWFFLNAYPQFKLQTRLTGIDQVGLMPRITDEGNVYEVRIDVTDEQLSDIRHGLRQGLVGRAKITTVSRALGYVLLRKVIRFFRVTFF